MCHSAPLRPGCAAPVGNCGPLPGLWAASCPGSGSSPLQPHLRARPQLLTPRLQACPSVRTDPGPGCSNTQFTESQEQYERRSGTVQDVLRLTSRNVCARVHVCVCACAPWPRPALRTRSSSRQHLSQGRAAQGTQRALVPSELPVRPEHKADGGEGVRS